MSNLRIAYLGSTGSFTQEAAHLYAEREGRRAELIGAPDPTAVLASLTDGTCERAVLPVANSTGGLVWPSLAALGRGDFRLIDEVVLAVRFELFAARAGLGLADIERVASHPQAFRQCARSLARLLPGRATLAWSDTASAARDLAAGVLGPGTAVLAALRAGEGHGLARLASDVQDEPDNRTFFAVLGRGVEPASGRSGS